MLDPSEIMTIGKRVATDFSEKNVTFMAAGIAYNAFVSLAPLLILLLLVISSIGGGLEDRLLTVAQRSLPGPIGDVIGRIFTRESAATSASIVGLVVLIWGTLKIFRGLDTAFSEIYETTQSNSFLDQLVDGLVVLVALGISIVATVAVSGLFAALSDDIPFIGLLTPVVLVAGLVIAFYPMYYRFPDADLGWREVLPGVLFAAVGWALLQAIFQVYLVFSGSGSESFFGGVIVVVTWLYFSGLVLLLGAVLNAVIGNHSSGAPGGVGRGAAGKASDTESKTTLESDELATYLRDLRRQLTGHYAEIEPAAGSTEEYDRLADNVTVTEFEGTVRRFRPITPPNDEVMVIERSRQADGERTRAITLRWRTAEGESAD